MGEVRGTDIAFMLVYTKDYLCKLMSKGIAKSADFMLLCIVISQYLGILYAEYKHEPVPKPNGSDEYFYAYPSKMLIFIKYKYQGIGKLITGYRNTICHNVGSPAFKALVADYKGTLTDIMDFAEYILNADKDFISKKTALEMQMYLPANMKDKTNEGDKENENKENSDIG